MNPLPRTRFLGPLLSVLLLSAIAACSGPPPNEEAAEVESESRIERVERLLTELAHDSMQGRRAGSEGAARARRMLVAELERYGVEPAGDAGSFEHRVVLVRGENGRYGLLADGASLDEVPEEDRLDVVNVVGMIPGSDPAMADEVIVVGAHYDHVGVGVPVEGDSIYNGADDDASGVVASLEIARALAEARAAGEGVGRSVLITLFDAEEMGLLGTRDWVDDPTVPLERIVAGLMIEMIGRPDGELDGAGQGWLTGYERSTMGDILAAQGSPIVPDPRPEQNFFFRSDNLPFAERGIPAHTLSSFGLHGDYHRPSDEVDMVDFAHMTSLIDAAEAMIRELASGPTPEWKEGGRPSFGG